MELRAPTFELMGWTPQTASPVSEADSSNGIVKCRWHRLSLAKNAVRCRNTKSFFTLFFQPNQAFKKCLAALGRASVFSAPRASVYLGVEFCKCHLRGFVCIVGNT